MKSPAITTTLEGKNKTLYLQVNEHKLHFLSSFELHKNLNIARKKLVIKATALKETLSKLRRFDALIRCFLLQLWE